MKELVPIEIPSEERFLPHYLDSFRNYVLGCYRDDESNLPIHFFEYPTDKHLFSIAPTRKGKGRGLILPNLLSLWDHSVFVIDPKGENALVSASFRKRQGHEILIFNPHNIYKEEFEKRGFKPFQTFNPLANLDPTKPSFTSDVNVIADALIYTTNGNSHWTDSARGLIAFLITFLVTQPGEDPTLKRLHTILSGGHKRLKEEVLDKAEENPNPLVYESVGRYLTETTEVIDIIATAQTQTILFKDPEICSALDGEAFDFGQMKNRKISIYVILPSAYLSIQERYLRLLLLVAMSHFMRTEKGAHQVLMMLDEFANLGALSIIEKGYGLIAGHGVTLWAFVQNLTQLQKLYPKNWEVFITNSSVVTVSNVNDPTTAEYFNHRAARHEVDKTPNNEWYNTNRVDGEIIRSAIILVLLQSGKIICRFPKLMMQIQILCFYFLKVNLCQQSAKSCGMMRICRSRVGRIGIRCMWKRVAESKKTEARTIVLDKMTNHMRGYK